MAADPKTEWRNYTSQQPKPDYIIGVSSSVTADPLAPYLGAHLLGKKYAPQVVFGDFNQIHQTCLDHKGFFGRNDLNAIVILWRIEDMFGSLLAQCLDNPGEALPQLFDEVRVLASAVARLRKDFKGTIIVSVPPYPAMPGYEAQDIGQPVAGALVYNRLAQLWTEEIAKIGRVRLIDLQGLLLQAGARNAHDARKWALYRQPYTESFWADIGRQAGRIIAAEKISPKKCIVLDLDNTLWGGIVGEDGLEGLALGDDFPGRAFRDFQRYLKHLQSKGVMLAVASKNNPDDAMEVFDRHDAMVLSRKDILVFEIHWESKVESLKRIAKKLNIGLDSFVFVDDNPKEIGEVQDRLPEVACVMVPEELAELPGILANTDFFDFAEVTDEDRRRTEMMAADVERQTIQENMSEDDFRKSLGLKIEVFEADKQHLARITQLINKTNQFNLTTVRRTQDEVEALNVAPDALVLGMDIKDKYGDYGLVGVSILKKQGTACIIDTLLMSCRVLGRGAEATFFSKLAEAATSLGCNEMRGKYIPTAKNEMVKDLYQRFNFIEHNGEWVLKIATAPATPAHIDAALRLHKKAG